MSNDHAVRRSDRSHHLRARWAAVGAAVAITLGAGTIATVDAVTSSGERTVYDAITPCRLLDTRTDFQTGIRDTPLGADETLTVPARGVQGDCTPADLPTDAVALQLNVTAVGATLPTFLAITPDGSRDTSSLNPVPGAPPAPNGVTVELDDDGAFAIYNLQGEVEVIVDVTGYYTDHDHDDRYYTRAESDERFEEATSSDSIVVRPLDFAAFDDGWDLVDLYLVSDGSGGGCADAPLDIAVGRSVESVEVTYTAWGSANGRVEVLGAISGPANALTEATTYDRHLRDELSFPSTVDPGPVFNRGTITVTDDPTDDPGFPAQPLQADHFPTLRICTSDGLTVAKAVVHLAPA